MIRRRLVLVATAGVALSLLPVTALFAVALSLVLHRDARVLLENRAAAAAATVDLRGGTLRPRETASDAGLDSSTWVFDRAGRVVEWPAGRGAGDAAAARLAARAPLRQPVADSASGLLLMAVPVGDPAHPAGVVVAGLTQAPYRDAQWAALAAALALDVVGLAGVALATARTVSATLAPVAVMTAQAADWGAHDVHRRFAAGARRGDELAGLAGTLNGLLARVAASLGHERRLTAEIAHELRTPLARMRVGAETVLRADHDADDLRAVLTEVIADTAQLAEVIDTLLHAADGRVATAGVQVEVLLAEAVRGLPDGRVRTGPVDGLPPLAVERAVALRVLAPLLDNAVGYARSAVLLSARTGQDQVVIAIRDDGPGFAAGEQEDVFAPGVRGRAAQLAPDGVGLGLPLARRLAREAGGDVTASVLPDGGLVEVSFPAIG